MRQNLPRLLVYLLIFFIILDIGLIWVYQGKKTLPQLVLDPSPSPTPAPPFSPQVLPKQYEEGNVAVIFKEGVTYKEAKDLLSSFDLEMEDTNLDWEKNNFKPDGLTKLGGEDVFIVNVPIGREYEAVRQLLRERLVLKATLQRH